MVDRGYALDMSSPVRRVATELDRVAPAALSISDLANKYDHIIGGDLSRVKLHNKLATDREANTWIIEEAIRLLERYLVIEVVDGERMVRFADGVTFNDLRYDRRKLVRYVDEHARLRDPFNPMSGWASENIRVPVTESKKSKEQIEADEELLESMRRFGWKKEFPAIQDERGVLLVGHRRMTAAKLLGIEPVIITVKLGRGDEADAGRLELALTSNAGVLAMSRADRKHIAEHLYQGGWTMQRIGEALRVDKATVSRDLEGVVASATTSRPQGGRPKGAARQHRSPAITPAAEVALATAVLDEGKTLDEAVAAAGLGSVQMAKIAVAKERGRREALAEMGIVSRASPSPALEPSKIGDILEVLRNAARNGRPISQAELQSAISEIERLRGLSANAA